MTDFLFNWAPFLALVAGLLFGIYLLWLGSRTYVLATRLKRNGLPGLGRVTRKYTTRITSSDDSIGRRDRYRNHIDYEFSVSGKRYETTKALPSASLWEAAEPGTDVDIIFVPGNPDNNTLAEHGAVAGQAGGTVQMIVGTALTSGAALYLITGFLRAILLPDEFTAGPDWVEDIGEVYAIMEPEDPFVRIARPKARLVRFAVGDSMNGQDWVGYLDMIMPPDDLPNLTEGDVMKFMRHPVDKYQAVLIRP